MVEAGSFTGRKVDEAVNWLVRGMQTRAERKRRVRGDPECPLGY
jgi:hypothetical protein